jgi:hypothetical protein
MTDRHPHFCGSGGAESWPPSPIFLIMLIIVIMSAIMGPHVAR